MDVFDCVVWRDLWDAQRSLPFHTVCIPEFNLHNWRLEWRTSEFMRAVNKQCSHINLNFFHNKPSLWISISFHVQNRTKRNLKSLNQARYNYAIAALREKIYVAGGRSDVDSVLSSVECYDILNDKWTMVSQMNHPRENFALISSHGSLYAIGSDRTIEQYDPIQNSWTEVCFLITFMWTVIYKHV